AFLVPNTSLDPQRTNGLELNVFHGNRPSPWQDGRHVPQQVGRFHAKVHAVHRAEELMRFWQRSRPPNRTVREPQGIHDWDDPNGGSRIGPDDRTDGARPLRAIDNRLARIANLLNGLLRESLDGLGISGGQRNEVGSKGFCADIVELHDYSIVGITVRDWSC